MVQRTTPDGLVPEDDFSDTGEFVETIREYGTKIDFENVGDVFIGKYIGVDTVDIVDDKTQEVRPTKAYRFLRDGEQYTLWGSHNIEQGMEPIPVDSIVRVEYRGVADLKGGRSVALYRIAYRK